MSASLTYPETSLYRPLRFFACWPRALQPADDSAMVRWANALAHKPLDYYLYLGGPVLAVLSAVMLLLALPFVWLSGSVSLHELHELVSMEDGNARGLVRLFSYPSYELVAGYITFVCWSLATWLPSKRSLWLSLLAIAAVLAVQATLGGYSLVLAFSMAMGWFMDELVGCKPQLSRITQLLVASAGVGVYACLNLALGNDLVAPLASLMLVVMMLLTTWYYFSQWSNARLMDTSRQALRAQASAAERERIGRDLHDLLGHTLSLITLKLELSRKLADSDPKRSRAEANDAETVARQALVQVRAAVTGMRATDLHGEIASAGLLLQSRGVSWQAHAPPPLPPALDTTLSLVLREAVTNIARHAEAETARLQFVVAGDVLQMIISDDGRGVGNRRGNGLTGMRERVEALDGVLSIEGGKGIGSQLTISVPLTLGGAAEPAA
jgi:two-component system sensor histidine kinase DesK